MGPGVPRPGPGPLRSHPGAGDGMAEQHPVPGYRLCLRWPSERFELSRTDRGVSPRRPRLPPPGQALPPLRARRGGTRPPRARRARHQRRVRIKGHRDRLRAADRDPRGARRGRPGGHEPLRPRPPLAALPAAHHEPGRHLHPRRPARTPRAGLHRLPRRRRNRRPVRREAHGLPRRPPDLPHPRHRPRPLRRPALAPAPAPPPPTPPHQQPHPPPPPQRPRPTPAARSGPGPAAPSSPPP